MSEVVILYGTAPSTRFLHRLAGPHRLATELRDHGISTKIVAGLGHYLPNKLIQLCNHFIDSNTLVLGISTTLLFELTARFPIAPTKMRPGNRFKEDIRVIAEYYKRRYPRLKIVVGGPAPRKVILDTDNIDLFIEGYADEVFVNYVNSLKGKHKPLFYSMYHHNTPLIQNPVDNDFDFRNSFIRYTKEDCIFPGETLPLEIARGCIFKCRFCSFPARGKFKGDTNFLKCEANIYDELLRNYDEHGTTNYVFVDDTFNDSTSKMEYLNTIFKKLPFKINFAAYLRADLLATYPETVDLLGEMGIRGAYFGIETFHEPSRKATLKGLSPDKIIKILEQVNAAWKNNVSITSSFIYGLPHESLATATKWTDEIVFGTTLFDRHDLIFHPLYIAGKAGIYQSDFDIDPEKFGYTIGAGGQHDEKWISPTTCSSEMHDFAVQATLRASKTPRPFNCFQTLTIMGYGLSTEKAININCYDPADVALVENLTMKMYLNYAKMMVKK